MNELYINLIYLAALFIIAIPVIIMLYKSDLKKEIEKNKKLQKQVDTLMEEIRIIRGYENGRERENKQKAE